MLWLLPPQKNCSSSKISESANVWPDEKSNISFPPHKQDGNLYKCSLLWCILFQFYIKWGSAFSFTASAPQGPLGSRVFFFSPFFLIWKFNYSCKGLNKDLMQHPLMKPINIWRILKGKFTVKGVKNTKAEWEAETLTASGKGRLWLHQNTWQKDTSVVMWHILPVGCFAQTNQIK